VASPGRPTLLYDDGCRFCRACARGVQRWDRAGRFDILPWSDAEAVGWLRGLAPALRDRSMHLRDADGRLHSQDDALLQLLALLPGGGMVAVGARRLPFLRWALAGGYDLVARNRARLSRLVPDTPPVTRRAGSPPATAAR
jgi:predicted DCC family thiol-disulfide oxidoreductase YuxK